MEDADCSRPTFKDCCMRDCRREIVKLRVHEDADWPAKGGSRAQEDRHNNCCSSHDGVIVTLTAASSTVSAGTHTAHERKWSSRSKPITTDLIRPEGLRWLVTQTARRLLCDAVRGTCVAQTNAPAPSLQRRIMHADHAHVVHCKDSGCVPTGDSCGEVESRFKGG